MSATPAANDRRIAIVAVHGVGNQAPNETVRAIASLLQRVDAAPEGAVRYTSFSEDSLRLRIDPLATQAAPAKTKRAYFTSQFAAEAGQVAADRSAQFIAHQIARYDASQDSRSYETVRLNGTRIGQQRTELHLYEMYWADLSNLGSGLLRMASEFYQLFFHVSNLGRDTVELGLLAHPERRDWRLAARMQRVCSYLLTLPIGLLNLFLPLLALLLLPALIPPEYHAIVAAAACGVAGLVAAATLLAWTRYRVGLALWLIVQALGLAAGAGIAWWLANGLLLPASLCVFGLAIVLFAIGLVLVNRYSVRQPGAKSMGCAIAALLMLTLLLTWPGNPLLEPRQAIVDWVGWHLELVFLALVMFWALLCLFHLLTWACGEVVIWRTPAAPPGEDHPETARRSARRTIWTGRIALGLPAGAFLLVTLTAWAGVLSAIRGDSTAGQLVSLPYKRHFASWLDGGDATTTLIAFGDELVKQSGGPFFNLFFLGITLAFVLALWAIVPSAFAELAPAFRPKPGRSLRLGAWLDKGLKLAHIAGALAVFSVLVILPAGFGLAHYGPLVAMLAGHLPWIDRVYDWALGADFLQTIGWIIAGSTIGIVALGSRLGRVFLGLRPVVDIALDVDNWLREHPLTRNPKSRICARFSSLLQHIARAEAAEGRKYDALIFVSHSQGTVITADLLRFIHGQHGRLPFDAPVFLLTVGCPLRQLYGLRFPELYRWARHQHRTGPGGAAAAIPQDQRPDPRELGVTLWVNAYRSGDYVGRSLWLDDETRDLWRPAGRDQGPVGRDAAAVATASRIEFCLAAGAHTHYFDATAQRVAEALDQLIAIASSSKPKYAAPYPVFSA